MANIMSISAHSAHRLAPDVGSAMSRKGARSRGKSR